MFLLSAGGMRPGPVVYLANRVPAMGETATPCNESVLSCGRCPVPTLPSNFLDAGPRSLLMHWTRPVAGGMVILSKFHFNNEFMQAVRF
jgi:hypothetical protein